MDIQIVAVEQNRGVRKERGRLVVVPDDTSYVVRLMLPDGRPAYLTGSLSAGELTATR
jgi:hypothetical protein